MSNTIKILVADDHTIVRQGLARLLEEQADLKVIGEATNGRKAVDLAKELMPDVVIMDIAMPRMNGIEAAKRIRKHLPKTKILILSMYSHEHYIHELLESGVSGYLLKDSSGRDIIKAIHAAMKDETYLSPSISKVLVEAYRSPRKVSSQFFPGRALQKAVQPGKRGFSAHCRRTLDPSDCRHVMRQYQHRQIPPGQHHGKAGCRYTGQTGAFCHSAQAG